MPRNTCFFDLLPVELLHTVFTYFLAHEILVSFFDVSDHVNAILLSYSSYRLDFKSILKCHFDLICRCIRPDQVITLSLSDADDTPGQSELFFSRFRIEQFTRLRSLKLINIEFDSLESIFSTWIKVKQLDSFSFRYVRSVKQYPIWTYDYSVTIDQSIYKCHQLSLRTGIVLKTMSHPRLHQLALTKSTTDELQMIFSQTSQLRWFDVSLMPTIYYNGKCVL